MEKRLMIGEKQGTPLTAKGEMLSAKFELIQQDVLHFRQKEIIQHVDELLAEGIDPDDIIRKGIIAAMEVINQQFKDGTVFIPEVLLSARTVNQAIEHIQPHLSTGGAETGVKVLIGTVKGDMHDIGKNMVAAMMRGVGFQVTDMGISVPAEKFVEEVIRVKPDVLGLSALLTTTMPEMRNVLDALVEAGLRQQIKVIVGGAPVNQRFADEIGADGYGHDGAEAVEVIRDLVEA
jgi:5-methyltetrahydrofolate--homocysteine methyltransferase